LLASHLSTKYTRDEYKLSLTKALKKAGKFPKVVISRHLADSINCLELKLGTNSKVIQARNLYASSGLKFLEIFHSSLRPRTQVLKGYKNLNSARIITQSWLVHYNYLKPNKILNNRTPAYTAGITTPLKIKIR
jgi:putative transposase